MEGWDDRKPMGVWEGRRWWDVAMAMVDEGGEWVRVGWAALDVNEGRIDTNCPSYTSRFGLSFTGGRLYLLIFFLFRWRRSREGMRAEDGSLWERCVCVLLLGT